MIKTFLTTSILTGLFCAGFTVVIGFLTETLAMWMVIGLSFVSGFSGSLLAQLIQGRGK